MLSSWISIVVQFALQASDPHQACERVHHDPGVAGTYYLYCAEMSPDGVELVTVGRFISDAKAKAAQQP